MFFKANATQAARRGALLDKVQERPLRLEPPLFKGGVFDGPDGAALG